METTMSKMEITELLNELSKMERTFGFAKKGREMAEAILALKQSEKQLKASIEKSKKDKKDADASLSSVQDKITNMTSEAEDVLKDAKDMRLKANRDIKKKKESSEKAADNIISMAKTEAGNIVNDAKTVAEKMGKDSSALERKINILQSGIKEKEKELKILEKTVSDRKASIEKALSQIQ